MKWLYFLTGTVKRKYLVLDLDETLIHSHHEGVRPLLQLRSPYYPPDLVLKVRVINKRFICSVFPMFVFAYVHVCLCVNMCIYNVDAFMCYWFTCDSV